jgi:hypothetical protein
MTMALLTLTEAKSTIILALGSFEKEVILTFYILTSQPSKGGL